MRNTWVKAAVGVETVRRTVGGTTDNTERFESSSVHRTFYHYDKVHPMAATDYIPGMKRGERKRNIVLLLVYILLLPILSTLSFIWAPVYVGRDYNGIRAELSAIPGISTENGLLSAFSTFMYLVLFSFGPQIVGWLGLL